MIPEEIKEPFLRRLRATIDGDENLTDAGLAVKAGLDNSAIRAMFKNAEKRSPRIDTARKICAALGTTLEVFMSEAKTAEEKELVHLVAQLPDHLRHELLGYGRALAAQQDQAQPGQPAGSSIDPDRK